MKTLFAKLKEILMAVLSLGASQKRIEEKQTDLATFLLGMDRKITEEAEAASEWRIKQALKFEEILAALGSPDDEPADNTAAQAAIDAEAATLKGELDVIEGDLQSQK